MKKKLLTVLTICSALIYQGCEQTEIKTEEKTLYENIINEYNLKPVNQKSKGIEFTDINDMKKFLSGGMRSSGFISINKNSSNQRTNGINSITIEVGGNPPVTIEQNLPGMFLRWFSITFSYEIGTDGRVYISKDDIHSTITGLQVFTNWTQTEVTTGVSGNSTTGRIIHFSIFGEGEIVIFYEGLGSLWKRRFQIDATYNTKTGEYFINFWPSDNTTPQNPVNTGPGSGTGNPGSGGGSGGSDLIPTAPGTGGGYGFIYIPSPTPDPSTGGSNGKKKTNPNVPPPPVETPPPAVSGDEPGEPAEAIE